MPSLKELYKNAKHDAKQIPIYEKTVLEYSRTSPASYLSNVKYIISADLGMKTLNPFIEKFGIPMAGYSLIQEAAEAAIPLCKQRGLDYSAYTNLLSYLEKYKNDHLYSFVLYEDNKKNDDYLSLYESMYKALAESKSLNINNILSRFGEAAIPDILTAHLHTDKLDWFKEGFNKPSPFMTPSLYQWIKECAGEHGVENCFYEKSLEGIVKSYHKEFKESYILNSLTESAISIDDNHRDTIAELLHFKEYALLFVENTDQILKDIREIHEDFDFMLDEDVDIEEDVGNNVVPLLPGNGVVAEDSMTGDAPAYLKKAHDLSYGEDDKTSGKKKSNSSIADFDDYDFIPPKDAMRQYERPPKEDKLKLDPDKIDELKDDIKDAKTPEEKKQAINNYYYYTYMNSFNKSNDSSVKVSDSPNFTIGADLPIQKKSDDNIVSKDSSLKESADPEDDMPTTSMQDRAADIDRALVTTQQKAKKILQGVINTGATFLKPFRRTAQWIAKMANDWKAADENRIKERMANPKERKGLFKAIKYAIVTGSLFKAGLLFNPIFLYLRISRRMGKSERESRLRNELITELKSEIAIMDEKIKDAEYNRDTSAKYKLMRIKNELTKKLLRVGVNLTAGKDVDII